MPMASTRPGMRDWPTAIRVADNQLRAHAGAAKAIHALVDDSKVGVAIDVNQVAPATDSELDRIARRAVEFRSRRVVPRSAVRPRLPGAGTRGAPRGGPPRRHRSRRAAGRRSRLPGPELLPARLGQRAGRTAPFDWDIGAVPDSEQTQMDWHVAPDGLRDTLLDLHRTYAPREIVVTENGAAYPDTVDADGRVHDADRVEYLARHVAAAAEALAGRRTADRLLRLVVHGQLRVEPRLHPAVRPGPRRLRHPAPHAEGQRALVQAAYRVSVTLLIVRGCSGSRPRATVR